MKKNCVVITVCDLCGRGYEIEEGHVGTTAYLVIDVKKDLVVNIDICPNCTKDMFGQVKRMRKEYERKQNVSTAKIARNVRG